MFKEMLSWGLALVLTAGCSGVLEVTDPVPLEPGAVQHSAAALVAACSGRTVSAGDVRWFVVEEFAEHPDALGGWEKPNSVYLLPAAVGDLKVNAHELLHNVLRGNPSHSHPLWALCGVMP